MALETCKTEIAMLVGFEIREYSDTEFPAPDSVDGFSIPRTSVREIESLGFLATFEYPRQFGNELFKIGVDI